MPENSPGCLKHTIYNFLSGMRTTFLTQPTGADPLTQELSVLRFWKYFNMKIKVCEVPMNLLITSDMTGSNTLFCAPQTVWRTAWQKYDSMVT